MTVTQSFFIGTSTPVLYLAFELGRNEWKLAFATAPADNPRLRRFGAPNLTTLRAEITKAKQRFVLPKDWPMVSCYEAGRDGFWLHRYLLCQGIANSVVNSSSIEVKLRGRRCQTDNLDPGKRASMLIR
jgi:transposase